MKQIRHLWLITVSLLVLTACSGGGDASSDDANDSTATDLPAVLQNGTTTLDLGDYFMPFSIYIPDSMRGIPTIEETGYGETVISVGSTFHMVAAEGGDLNLFKTEMMNDLMYKNTVVEEGEDFILYKSEIDGSFLDPEFHFYSVKTLNGVPFEFHDFNEEGGYAESVARFMLESVNHLIVNQEAS